MSNWLPCRRSGPDRRTDHREERLILLPEVLEISGLSRSRMYEAIHEGTFPSPVHTGKRRSAWVKSEVHAWVRALIATERSHRSTSSRRVRKAAQIT